MIHDRDQHQSFIIRTSTLSAANQSINQSIFQSINQSAFFVRQKVDRELASLVCHS